MSSTGLFSPDGRRILTGGSDRTARLWDAATGEPVGARVLAHGAAVEAAAFGPDGKVVLTGGDQTARLWDAGHRRGRPVLRHRGPVKAAAFSPDGRFLATGSAVATSEAEGRRGTPGEARLWRVGNGQLLHPPLPHPGPVWSVAFSPTGQTLLTGCEDAHARLFRTATGTAVGRPLGNEGTVRAVHFSPDGRTALMASAGTAGTRENGFFGAVAAVGGPPGAGLPHSTPAPRPGPGARLRPGRTQPFHRVQGRGGPPLGPGSRPPGRVPA